jgi:hypothetical protein
MIYAGRKLIGAAAPPPPQESADTAIAPKKR